MLHDEQYTLPLLTAQSCLAEFTLSEVEGLGMTDRGVVLRSEWLPQ
jgi:hypothetical protein